MFGTLTGVIFSLWIGLGAIIYGKSPIEDDLPVGQCLDYNITMFNYSGLHDAYNGDSSMMINQTAVVDEREMR